MLAWAAARAAAGCPQWPGSRLCTKGTEDQGGGGRSHQGRQALHKGHCSRVGGVSQSGEEEGGAMTEPTRTGNNDRIMSTEIMARGLVG